VVLIGEHRIEDPLHTSSIRENTHRTGSSSHLPKPSLNRIGGPYLGPPRGVLDSKEAHKLFFIDTQTVNRLGVDLIPSRAERSQGRRVQPKFSVERYAKGIPFKDQAETERLIEALRKAGLK